MKWLIVFFEDYKGARRLCLLWAVSIITIVLERASRPEIFTQLTPEQTAFVGLVVGILTVVIKFYHDSRGSKNDAS